MKKSKQKHERAIKHRDEVMEILINKFDFSVSLEAGVYYSKKLKAEMGVAGTNIAIEFDSESIR